VGGEWFRGTDNRSKHGYNKGDLGIAGDQRGDYFFKTGESGERFTDEYFFRIGGSISFYGGKRVGHRRRGGQTILAQNRANLCGDYFGIIGDKKLKA